MTFDWQTAVVILIVLAAAFYVGRMALRRVRSMRGRGATSLPDCCSGCDAGQSKRPETPAPKVLVQIGRAATRQRRR